MWILRRVIRLLREVYLERPTDTMKIFYWVNKKVNFEIFKIV